MAELCTLDEIKTHPSFRRLRSATVDTADEEFLQMAISAVSSRFEKTTGRFFPKGSYTEYFSPCEGQMGVQLKGFPVESITSFIESSTSTWTDAGVDASSYGLDSNSGLLRYRYVEFLPGVNTVRVVYVGGFDPVPADLKYACMLQTAHEVELAPKTLLSSQQTQSGGQASYAPMEYLPAVRAILATYQIARL